MQSPVFENFFGLISGLKLVKEVLGLLNFLNRTWLCDLIKLFHDLEVGSHFICESSGEAKFWDEVNDSLLLVLLASDSALEEGLLRHSDIYPILILDILHIRLLNPFLICKLVEPIQIKLKLINPIELLVVLGHAGLSDQTVIALSLGPQFLNRLQHVDRPQDLATPVDVDQTLALLVSGDQRHRKSRPNLKIELIKPLRVLATK